MMLYPWCKKWNPGWSGVVRGTGTAWSEEQGRESDAEMPMAAQFCVSLQRPCPFYRLEVQC